MSRNLAAATDLDRAEQDPVWALNAIGPENLELVARQRGISMVQVSTVGIFCGDGRNGPPTLFAPSTLSRYAMLTETFRDSLKVELGPVSGP